MAGHIHPKTRVRLGGGGARLERSGPAAAVAEERERDDCRRAYLRLGAKGRRGKFGKARWRLDDARALKRNPLYELLADCRAAVDAGASEADATAGLELVLSKVRAHARVRDAHGADVVALHVAHTREHGEAQTAVAVYFASPSESTRDALIAEGEEAHSALGRLLDFFRAGRALRRPPPRMFGITPTGVALGLHH